MRFNKPFEIVSGYNQDDKFDTMVMGLENYRLDTLSAAVMTEFHTGLESYNFGFEENVVVRVFRRIYEFIAGLFRRIRELFTKRRGKEKIEKAKEIIKEVKTAEEVKVPAARVKGELATTTKGEVANTNGVAIWRNGKALNDGLEMEIKATERWLFGDAPKTDLSDMLNRADTAIEMGNQHIIYLTNVISEMVSLIRDLLGTAPKAIGSQEFGTMDKTNDKHVAAMGGFLKRLTIPEATVLKNSPINVNYDGEEIVLPVVSCKPQTYNSTKEAYIRLATFPQESELQAVAKRYAESEKLQEKITKTLSEIEANKQFFEKNAGRVHVDNPDNLKLAVGLLDAASRSSSHMVEGISIAESAVGTMMSIIGDLSVANKSR